MKKQAQNQIQPIKPQPNIITYTIAGTIIIWLLYLAILGIIKILSLF